MAVTGKQILSSLPLQTLLYFNAWYVGLFLLLEILLLIYKNAVIVYPSSNLAIDFILLFLFVGMEYVRIVFGIKGNLTERTLPMIISILWLIPSAALVLYFLLWQTFVFKVDIIITGIMLAIYVIELILSLMSVVVFARYAAV